MYVIEIGKGNRNNYPCRNETPCTDQRKGRGTGEVRFYMRHTQIYIDTQIPRYLNKPILHRNRQIKNRQRDKLYRSVGRLAIVWVITVVILRSKGALDAVNRKESVVLKPVPRPSLLRFIMEPSNQPIVTAFFP